MKKHKISKLALLTGLLMINTNTKGFYQCVPKQDWFKKQYYILTLEDKFRVAKTQINNHNLWILVEENKTSGSLGIGIYKVIVAGGCGGGGGSAGKDYEEYNVYYYRSGGAGAVGEISMKLFYIDRLMSYAACIGLKGRNGSVGAGDGGSGGGGGAGSAFKINDLEIMVSGGGGGGGASSPHGGGGGGGGGYGCEIGGRGGWGNNSYDHVSGGNIVRDRYLGGAKGIDGGEDYGNNGGSGGKGGRPCANGGVGGTDLGSGVGGNSCATKGNGNTGDGYVKIYKYIG